MPDRRNWRRSANDRMLRHCVVQRRFRPFVPSTKHGTMPPWLNREDHANRIRRAATMTCPPIRLTPVLSVLRRQRTRSARHLTCSVSAELRFTQQSNEVTSNASSSARRPCLVSDTAQAPERSEGGPHRSHAWCIQKYRQNLRRRFPTS